MARPIWSGFLSFGLVQIPVVLHSGENRSDLRFNLVDSRDHARIRYDRVNETTGEEVPWSDIVKAYELDDNNYVVLKDEDFKRAAPAASKTIDIEDFVPRQEITPEYFDRPYLLVPGKGGEKGYVLLREVLRDSDRVGVARIVIRTRQHLAAVIAERDALVLNVMRFHQELRPPAELPLPHGKLSEYRIHSKELQMAEQLVKAMSGPWKPQKYHDEYRDALMKWIRKKAASPTGVVAAEPEPDREPSDPINMMEWLSKSLKARGGASSAGRRATASSKRAASPKSVKARRAPARRKSA
ncbi:MAG: Ku protein [Phycisphaerales bacterium]